MRVFQNIGLTRGYYRYFRHLPKPKTFAEGTAQFLATRYGASHILLPVQSGHPDAFFTNADNRSLQLLWAQQNGLKSTDLLEILLAQIEHHRTEVFYNLDPLRFGGLLARKLPGSVRKSICWRAAPSGNADLSDYGLVVCNFPSILADWKQKGCKVAYFAPAHDTAMDELAGTSRRSFDVVFAGGFSQEHVRRAAALDAVAKMNDTKVRYYLENSRFVWLSERLPIIPALRKYRQPEAIARVRAPARYGMDLYKAFADARLVLNGAIDMAGNDRGNMRCFEATGCGALLLTDAGNYPDGFVDGETMVTYSDPAEIPDLVRDLLNDPLRIETIARAGYEMVRGRYSKSHQWESFVALVDKASLSGS